MRAKLEKIMYEVATDTLEKLAFLFAFRGDESGLPSDPVVTGKVSFTGPFSGDLFMTISIEVLQELTSNMLGLDDDEDTAAIHQSDALKETMNVICGNLLPAIVGDALIFDIGVPEILFGDQETGKGEGIFNGLNPAARVNLAFDEGQCILLLLIDGEIPEGVVSA